MKIRLRGTSKRNIIILAVLAVVFLGSGGYLLWRVNQADTVAPTDSDAGGGNFDGSCEDTCSCNVCVRISDGNAVSGTRCMSPHSDTNLYKTESNCGKRNAWIDENVTSLKKCYRHLCPDNVYIMSTTKDITKACNDCDHKAPKPAGECDVGSQCPSCAWPNVGYCTDAGTCTCRHPNNFEDDVLQCGKIEKPEPPACPPNMTDCGITGDGKDKTGCEKYGEKDETACSICNNKTYAYRFCKDTPPPTPNTCDSGNWIKRPQGTYEYCEPVEYSFVAKDKDGIKSSSILVKLNNTNRPSIVKTAATVQTTVSEVLSTTDDCLDPGTYKIDATWADSLGATSTSCTLATTFTILEEVLNPNWEIEKTVGEQCIDEDTETPSAVLSYTVTVTNTGDGSGQLDKIIDELDTKVLEEYLGSISSDGVYTDGTIVWDLEGATETFEAGEERTYTYTITVPFAAFGTYSNTVTGYPREGENVIDSAVIDADCEITETPEEPEEDLPETGIFDDIRVTLLLGTGLILVGISWNKLSGSLFFLGNVVKNGKKNHEEKIVRTRREKLEKKVVKRQ